MIIQLNPDGSLDTNFNSTGYYTSDDGFDVYLYAAHFDRYGRLVVAGATSEGSKSAFIRRFDSDADGDGFLTSAELADGTDPLDYSSNKSVMTPAIGLEVKQTGTLLEWTVEEERNVKEYNIFIDGKLFDTVNAQNLKHYSLTVFIGDVVLTVVDYSGHVKSHKPADGNSVTEIYNLKRGWNLIAVTSDNVAVDQLKDVVLGKVWGWNGHAYYAINSVKATDAVWVYTDVAKTVAVNGQKSTALMTLRSGWNMVGPVVTSDVPKGAHVVYSWDTAYDMIVDKYNVLEQGKGYWIFSL